ncbi:hypothetical protein M413DRAFT_444950 [Hebeloma cylindrosporum]|uniref:Microbial-type PARG catalytic domain-containing protein n=1 Tax=Hebeloma cylindrosporum TaxID=76867 RepID=A0A0C2YL15_HEBCY|nr:hypothetical protein M413DRAFT_444950 [Hebeloma cylindrosporum h7]
MVTLPTYNEAQTAALKKIGEETLKIQRKESYTCQGLVYDLSENIEETAENSVFYPPNDPSIKGWLNKVAPAPAAQSLSPSSPTYISVLQMSALGAARVLEDIFKSNPEARGTIGVLCFAGPSEPTKKVSSGFNSQETSIARSTTLCSALTSSEGRKYYQVASSPGYHTHAILFCPGVTVFRTDDGGFAAPYEIDIVNCAAVNAGKVRQGGGAMAQPARNNRRVSMEKGISDEKGGEKEKDGPVEKRIENEMEERMGRILYVFEQRGVRNVVLGAFGAGYFNNRVDAVARIWAKLLTDREARFKESFDRVIFAITGQGTYRAFHREFDPAGAEAQFDSSGKD